MRNRVVVLVCVVALMVFATQAFAEYDKDMVVKAMRSNGASMGAIQKAIKDGDFFMAAEKLMVIAQNIKSLDAVTPPKGSKEEWDTIHQNLVNAAFKGIGACGEQDGEKLGMYVGEVGKFIKEGHGMFK